MKKILALLITGCLMIMALAACGNGNNAQTKDAAETAAVQGSASQEAESTDKESSEPTKAASGATGDYAGTYTLYAIGEGDDIFGAEEYGKFISEFVASLSEAFGGGTENAEISAQAEDIGESTLVINKNGTAKMIVFGTESECTWTGENGSITLVTEGTENEESSTISGTLKDGILTLTDSKEGETMIFAAEGADTSEIETKSMADLGLTSK